MLLDTTPPLSEAQLAELREKHKLAIDAVLEMNTPAQKQVFRNLGVRPRYIKEYYDDLIQKSDQLNNQHVKAEKASTLFGWMASAATVAAFYLVPSIKRFHHASKAINAISAGIASIFAGFGVGYISTRILNHKTRVEAHTLIKDARTALTDELAVALEIQSQKNAAEQTSEKTAPFTERMAAPENNFVNRRAAKPAPNATPSL